METATPERVARLRRDVERLATPAGRMVGTAGHDAARRYLLDRMGEVGLQPFAGGAFEACYRGGGVDFQNLFGVVPGTGVASEPVVLIAHYDTCGPLPGADDNAAAIAILLEAVAPLRERKLPRPVLVAFPDAEEPPHCLGPDMGSVRFYREQRQGPVHAAIVLDLVGHDVPVPGLEDLLFATGMESDGDWQGAVEAAAAAAALRFVPVLNRYVGDVSDHHAFRLARQPYLFLSCAHWEHYHAPTDTAEKLNYEKMAEICAFLVEAADCAARAAMKGPFEGWDSTPVELAYMREAMAPLLSRLGIALRNRADIDRAVAMLLRMFAL